MGSPPLVELASSPPLFPRSCSRWLVLRIATPPPRAQLEPLETLPRPPTLPLLRPTAISPPTSGRRLSSPSLPTRSSQTSLPRTTAPRVFRSRRPGPTSHRPLDALEDGDVKISVLLYRLLSSGARDCESGINPGHSRKK